MEAAGEKTRKIPSGEAGVGKGKPSMHFPLTLASQRRVLVSALEVVCLLPVRRSSLLGGLRS